MTIATATVAACCSSTGECRDCRDFWQIERSRVAGSASFFLRQQEWLPLRDLISLSPPRAVLRFRPGVTIPMSLVSIQGCGQR
ncbi:hypothetical protein TIFTF001_019083 [Ficus carica]|uniref:Uncharacterized protein n=1 Tax=Ficus carica TaxID=3494 RepID=A0AA88A5T0_FICCA|nr:hypothetical protein TIFTF001_019083 [Ficus carica]